MEIKNTFQSPELNLAADKFKCAQTYEIIQQCKYPDKIKLALGQINIIENVIHEIGPELLGKDNKYNIYLYGSQITERARPDSDIDLLVVFQNVFPIFCKFFNFKELEDFSWAIDPFFKHPRIKKLAQEKIHIFQIFVPQVGHEMSFALDEDLPDASIKWKEIIQNTAVLLKKTITDKEITSKSFNIFGIPVLDKITTSFLIPNKTLIEEKNNFFITERNIT